MGKDELKSVGGVLHFAQESGVVPYRQPTRRESRLMEVAEEVQRSPAAGEGDDLSYWPRGLIQCTLPHSNPGNVAAYSRRSGAYYLLIEPGHRLEHESGKVVRFGFPYGSYPRLVCSYLAREVKRQPRAERCRTVSLGDTLSEFMLELGLSPTGGRWGTIPALRKQVLALVNAKVSFGYSGPENVAAGGQALFADRYELWWNHGAADQTNLFPNYVRLSGALFEEIIEHAVPVDVRILKALKQSSLGLDLYAFATYKVFGLKSSTAISWKQLHSQFGTGYSDTRNFRRVALKQLLAIKSLYPEFKYRLERGRIVLLPSRTSVLAMPQG